MLVFLSISAQSQYQWVKQAGGSQSDGAGLLIKDNFGNLYIVGSYSFNCYFNIDTLGNYGGDNDLFILKLNSSGVEQWVKRIGGDGAGPPLDPSDRILGLVFDSLNNYIYMTGRLYGTAIFDNDTLDMPSGGFFLAKYDLNGNCIWARQATPGLGSGSGVTVDNSGNVYVCGTTKFPVQLGTESIPAGAFFAKYDPSGNCLWAKKEFEGKGSAGSIKIHNNNIIMHGVIGDTVTVDTINIIHPVNTKWEIIGSFDINGNVQWVKSYRGATSFGGIGLDFVVDDVGNIYTTGTFFGTVQVGSYTLANGTQTDILVAKFDNAGNLIWVKQTKASGGASGVNIGFNKTTNDVYVIGYYSGSIDIDGFTNTAQTTQDCIILRFNNAGLCMGVSNFGYASGYAILSDANYFVATGAFSNSITIGSYNLISYGASDGFIAKGDAITGIVNRAVTASSELLIYANPNKGTCTIKVPEDLKKEDDLVLTIYDVNGRIIQQAPVQINEEKIKINIESEASGIYNVTLGNKTKMYSGKIIFE